MIRARRLSLPVFALLSAALALPAFVCAQSSIIANAPVKNFRLPTFNEAGNRLTLLRGGEARYVSNTQIDILELNFAQFLGDGSTETENLLLAPSATVFIKENNQLILTGRESVRLLGRNVEAAGENWSFDYKNGKRLIINQNVRVVFRAELKGILD